MSSFLLIEKMKSVNKKIENWTPIKSIYYSRNQFAGSNKTQTQQ